MVPGINFWSVLGEDHYITIGSINNLGVLLNAQGKLDEAVTYYREALEKFRKVHGEDHPNTIIALINLGMLLEKMDRRADAEPLLRTALEKRAKVLGEDHPETLLLLTKFGESLNELGRQAETVTLLAPAESRVRLAADTGNKGLLRRYLMALGRAKVSTSEFASAAENLSEAWSVLRTTASAPVDDKQDTLNGLVSLYEAWSAAEPENGHDVEASKWRRQLADLMASIQPADESR